MQDQIFLIFKRNSLYFKMNTFTLHFLKMSTQFIINSQVNTYNKDAFSQRK